MNNSGAARLLCVILAVLMAAYPGLAQTPATAAPENPASQAPAAPAQPAATQPSLPPKANLPESPDTPLSITILEGQNAINSIPLLRSVAPVVQVVDQNGFPVEGATVVFTLPGQGPGGTFTLGGTSFNTRSDSGGQAASLLFVPNSAGKFVIKVTATSGQHRGEALIHQTNTTKSYVGPAPHKRSWYKRKLTWIIIGGVVVAVVVVIVVTKSSSKGVTITPGVPVF